MTVRQIWAHLLKEPKDALYYLQGTFRLSVYRSPKFFWLVRPHIREQFEFRVAGPANVCFKAGECRCCGCETPALFFANKGCSATKSRYCQSINVPSCYGPMLGKKEWETYKKDHGINTKANTCFCS